MIRKTLVPESKTVTLSFKVPAKYIGKKIEIIAFDKGEADHTTMLNSPSLPGDRMSIRGFKNWIKESESGSFTTLDEAKKRWESQRKKLREYTK